MSFDWTQYLFLAEQLNKEAGSSPKREAMLRSAISRAYYAAFCHSRKFLVDQKNKVIPSNPAAHGLVRELFEDNGSTLELTIATNLDRLRIERNKADYDDEVSGIDSMPTFALKLCQEVFLNIRELEGQ